MARSDTKSLTIVLIAIELLVAAACVGLIVIGAMRIPEAAGVACLAAGLVGIVVAGAMLPLVLMLRGLVTRLPTPDDAANLGPMLRSLEQAMSRQNQNSMLSDIAKRVLFRDQELDLIRRAIEEDIARGDYNAGLTLCDDMANLFGRREEAEAFRTRILQAGHAAYEAQVRQALERLDQILLARDWASAHREAASIRRLYPSHHLVQDLDGRVMRARDEHKRDLETQFVEAAGREDVESAMGLLKKLDRYLTREEAVRLAETAQAVINKHRENLTTQFKLAVNDHRWAEAAAVGDVIISEYPNTKMADEVRSMIEVLRVRASQAAMAS